MAITHIAVVGRQATPRTNEVRIVDVSDPQSPTIVQSSSFAATSVHTLSAVWPRPTSIGLPGLRERDTMGLAVDPSTYAMSRVYHADTTGMYADDAASSPRLGISMLSGASLTSSLVYGMSVVDFTDPAAPVVHYNETNIGSRPRVCIVDGVVGGTCTGLVLVDNGTNSVVRQYDLDDPTAVAMIHEGPSFPRHSVAGICHIGGGYFALAFNLSGAGTTGLKIIEASTRGSASTVAQVQWDASVSNIQRCWYAGNGILLVGTSTGIASYDVSTPSSPTFLQHLTGLVPRRAIAVTDDFVAVADDTAVPGRRLTTLDISNPAAMTVDNYLGMSLTTDLLWADWMHVAPASLRRPVVGRIGF